MLLPILPSPHQRKARPACENVLPSHPNPVELARKPRPCFPLLNPSSCFQRTALPTRCSCPSPTTPLSCCVGREGVKGAHRNSIFWLEPMSLVHEPECQHEGDGKVKCVFTQCPPGNSNSAYPKRNSSCIPTYLAYLILHLTNHKFKNKNNI